MLWYDQIYQNHIKTYDALFATSYNITDISWKYYIGIMAVSTIKSDYLLSLLQNQFLLSGGEESWIIGGLEMVPEKLKCLAKINNILAHQPWKLQLKDIKEILHLWNKEELLQALLIFVFFHRQASILESLKMRLKESDNEQEIISDLITSKQNKIGNQLFECIAELNEMESDNEEQDKDKVRGKEVIRNEFNQLKISQQNNENNDQTKIIDKSKLILFILI